MVNESELRDTLLAVIETNKKLATAISVALSEVAAVREAIRGLDPTFSDNLAKHQEYYREATNQSTSAVLEGYDELCERVKMHLFL
jgi:hypothetical protein